MPRRKMVREGGFETTKIDYDIGTSACLWKDTTSEKGAGESRFVHASNLKKKGKNQW